MKRVHLSPHCNLPSCATCPKTKLTPSLALISSRAPPTIVSLAVWRNHLIRARIRANCCLKPKHSYVEQWSSSSQTWVHNSFIKLCKQLLLCFKLWRISSCAWGRVYSFRTIERPGLVYYFRTPWSRIFFQNALVSYILSERAGPVFIHRLHLHRPRLWRLLLPQTARDEEQKLRRHLPDI